MALVFPTAPTNGQLYTSGANTWAYDSTTTSWLSRNASVYDFAGGIPGVPTASQIVAKYDVARNVSFPLSFAGSVWTAGTAATASTTFNVLVNGTSIGTIVFAAAGTTATFTTVSTGTTLVTAGSTLTIVAPATADATLADASGTLLGVLQ